MPPQQRLTTMEMINSLEHERQQLLNATDDWSFADETRRARIREIKATLESLWDKERQSRATRRMHSQPGSRKRT